MKEMSPNEPLDIKVMKNIPYSATFGCLIHSMTTIRLDLTYFNGQVSKFMINPSPSYWLAIKCF